MLAVGKGLARQLLALAPDRRQFEHASVRPHRGQDDIRFILAAHADCLATSSRESYRLRSGDSTAYARSAAGISTSSPALVARRGGATRDPSARAARIRLPTRARPWRSARSSQG